MFQRSHFKKLEMLGSGKKNTKIFKVEHILTKKIYALKEVEACSLDKLNEYKEEAVQLSKAQNHSNILQFYGYYFYETPHNTIKLGIVCEYINETNNLELVYREREKKKLYWKEEELLSMAYSLVDAFAFLQNLSICHRDIKPANLFLMDNSEVKIIDFGESKEYMFGDENDDQTMATIRGTPQYLSPILWRAHVLKPGTKQVEHNIYKSDVFSAGLVLFQLAAMRDVTGFNQKTVYSDGEKLIPEGLKMLSLKYSPKLIQILKLMLAFDESRRPTFIELAKIIFGNNYTPKLEKPYSNNRDSSGDSKFLMTENNSKNKVKTDEEKMILFNAYMEKQCLDFNMNKITYWFEYGGNIIAKFYTNKSENKWKLIGKYKSEFPAHFKMIYIDEEYGHLLIGGADNNNCFQYRHDQIVKKSSMNVNRSFMAVVSYQGMILAIGGYESIEKAQLKSIEVYDIEKDKWISNVYEDLKITRSQCNALVYKNDCFVFGGYNKNQGTLCTIEKISLDSRTTELLEIKIPIPLRRMGVLQISDSKILLLGGITRVCKESDNVYVLDLNKASFVKYPSLERPGIIDHEILVDEIGTIHLFFENNYGTSPPIHSAYQYFDFN